MSAKLIFSKHKVDIIFLSLLILISLIFRIYQIDSIPTNITGDESWDLSNIYRILYDKSIHPLTLLGDGANIALIFYPVAILIEIFGFSNSIFFLRLNIIFYSILSLIIFYYIVKKYTSEFISFLISIMLSTNYIFINFSRTAWVNMLTVFSSLALIYFLEKAINEKKYRYYLTAGVFGALGFYVYHFGKIFFTGILVYLIIKIILERFNKEIIRGTSIFIFSSFLVLTPIIFSINSERANSILTRPSATFAFSEINIQSSSSTLNNLLNNQIVNTFKGFVIFDKTVSNNGIENSRYVPPKSSPVNIYIQILFIIGLLFFIKKKYLIWWIVILFILLTQIITVLPPNFARGLLFIPLIYLIVGLLIFRIIKTVQAKTKISIYLIYFLLIIFTLFIIIIDINTYFSWMKQEYVYNARQPAIDYNEFLVWQDYQISLVKKGNNPITNQQWYEVRSLILKD